MTTRVTVEGDTMLAATLHRAAAELADLSATGRGAGELVRARAASNAPKRTGRLAGSVRASASRSEVVVASGTVYAARVNYGMPSVGQPAQPFLTNALGDTQKEVVARYERAVNAAVSHVRGA
jgi:HK97 gp10 family phage protein